MSDGLKHQMTYFDLVRGVSAELVVLGHAAVLAFPEVLAVRGAGGYLGARPGFHVQSYGVVIFLVLSGYLISTSVRRRRGDLGYGFGRYMVDRAARILTPLVPAIAVVFVLDQVVFRAGVRSQFVAIHDDATTVVSNLLLLQDNLVMRVLAQYTGLPITARSLGSAAPWWTVALEWWIYVAFGIVALVFARHRGSRRSRLVLTPVLAFALATVVATLLTGSGLALAWLVGFAYAWFSQGPQRLPRAAHAVVVVAAIAYLIVAFAVEGVPVYDYVADVVTAVAVMSGFHALPWDRLLSRARPVLVFASNVSYSVYLMHFSVAVWILALIPTSVPGWGRAAIVVICGNLVGVAWWWLFERRFPEVRDWLRSHLPQDRQATMRASESLQDGRSQSPERGGVIGK